MRPTCLRYYAPEAHPPAQIETFFRRRPARQRATRRCAASNPRAGERQHAANPCRECPTTTCGATGLLLPDLAFCGSLPGA
eukprot:5224807-Pyramimonas_sp.AAC.1